jgi:predicted glycoside hydrolase/deacetylase ChbG (UPF0249 family)
VTTKSVILCADDYGFNPQVCQGILALLAKGRLSAVSCMTTMPAWSTHASLLTNYHDKADIGLHFTLTDETPLTLAKTLCNADGKFFSLKELIIKAYLGQLNKDAIKQELQAQITAFFEQMKKLPDFIDGHQHIQQLPTIHQALIEVYQELNLHKAKVYIRVSASAQLPQREKLKAWIIRCLGAKAWQRALTKANIPHNHSFSGIYDFAQAANYANFFPGFLSDVANQGIIMCHPGHASDDQQDSIRAARGMEYDYFQSTEFNEACKLANAQPSRFQATN